MFKSANVGTTDRVLRIVAGVALALYAIYGLASAWQWLALVVAAILIITAMEEIAAHCEA